MAATTASCSPTSTRAASTKRIGTVNVAQAFLGRATEGDTLVDVGSTAGLGLPKLLIPFRVFALAETDPAAFERAIVARSDFGRRGARVVSVSPGSFDTAMGQLKKDHGATEPGYLTGTDILVDGGSRAGHEFRKSAEPTPASIER